ncbi:universal stress protein [Nocardia sp. NBC_00508]|uniref:universal stress protein n=1 Tax=Nocardia sp. NBC_00508 TaxID=2975992 RepID=UPI002E818FDC|nr:universal stress protein [Nocardia sp. NBC_00508]WUD65383.1 universal stress protein [Nocardia sp. NBC_00508]
MNPRHPSRRPIVAGTDGSAESIVAVRWAAQTAALHDAPLHIQLVMESSLGPDTDDPPRPAALLRVREADEAIERAAEAAEAAAHVVRDIAIGTEIRTAHIATALIERSRNAAMLVVGTRGVGRIQRVLLGSVSTAVARDADCPVAVVPAETPLWDRASTRPVVVGVDGSSAEQAAIEVAVTEASLRGVELVAVHTWGEIEPLAATGTDWTALRRTEEAVLATSLAGWQERFPEVAIQREVVRDRPERRLLERSRDGQLLVVGNRGRGVLSRLLFGSVSEALLRSVDRAIVIAR